MPALTSLNNQLDDLVDIFAKGARSDFQLRMNNPVAAEAEASFNRIAPTTQAKYISENFPGTFAIAEFEEFTGSVDYRGLNTYSINVASTEYARGVKFTRRELIADQKNIARLQRMPAVLATQAQKVKYANLATLLEANPTWEVDGVATFADNHFFGDNNISVNISDTTSPTEADVQLILDSVMQQFGTFVNDQGDPMTEIHNEMTKMVIVGKTGYSPIFRRVARQNFVPRSNAAIDNIDSDTFMYWGNQRLAAGTNVVYVVLAEAVDGSGNPLGESVPFVRTVFQNYDLLVGGEGGLNNDPVYRNNRSVEITSYGEEGLGVIDASRLMKVTLT